MVKHKTSVAHYNTYLLALNYILFLLFLIYIPRPKTDATARILETIGHIYYTSVYIMQTFMVAACR